jgi:hypothetical protein
MNGITRSPYNKEERVTKGVPTIDTNHAQIHEGNGFSIGAVFSIAAGAVLDISVAIPANAYVHYQATDISTDGANNVTAVLYEGATVTAATGTAIAAVNRKRMSPKASALTILQGATITATGTEIDRWTFPKTGTTPNVQGFVGKSDTNEWVLNPGSTYLLRISNTGVTTAATIAFRPFWYEESGA